MFDFNPYIFYANTTNPLGKSMLLLNITFFLFVSLGIILLTFLTTKYLAGRFNYQNSNKNIRIIEKYSLGIDKYLILVQVGTKYYLLSATKHSIEKIDIIENLNIKIEPTKHFEDIFSKLKIRK